MKHSPHTPPTNRLYVKVVQIHSYGVNMPPERSPLIDAQTQAVVLLWRTPADTAAGCLKQQNLSSDSYCVLVVGNRNVIFSVYI